jgi:hypothetical protein
MHNNNGAIALMVIALFFFYISPQVFIPYLDTFTPRTKGKGITIAFQIILQGGP